MKLSVIIPCHNAENYVGQAIGSLLEQTRTPDEIIVVDDASTDDSRAIAEAFGDQVLVLAARFGNACDARTYGYERCTGEAVMFLDADDVLGPTVCQALLAELGQAPGSVAACHWDRLELVDGRWIQQPPSCPPRRPGQDPLTAWLRGWYHPTSSVMWHRPAYEKAGGWDSRGASNDDGLLMMRALVRDLPLYLTNKGTTYYRRLPDGVATVSGTRFTRKGLEQRLFVLKEVARLLTERGRLRPYRGVLDEALKSIAVDCRGENEDLIDVCDRYRSEFGRRRWERPLEPLFRVPSLLRKFRHRHEPDEVDNLRYKDPEEVRYGIPSAEAAMTAAGVSIIPRR